MRANLGSHHDAVSVAPSTHGVDLLNGVSRQDGNRSAVDPRHAWMVPNGARESPLCRTHPYRQQLAPALQRVPLPFTR